MASLWQRFKMIFGAKVSSALDKAEDPTQTLDYSYEQQLSLLQNVKRGSPTSSRRRSGSRCSRRRSSSRS